MSDQRGHPEGPAWGKRLKSRTRWGQAAQAPSAEATAGPTEHGLGVPANRLQPPRTGPLLSWVWRPAECCKVADLVTPAPQPQPGDRAGLTDPPTCKGPAGGSEGKENGERRELGGAIEAAGEEGLLCKPCA